MGEIIVSQSIGKRNKSAGSEGTMVRILSLHDAPTVPMENGRGEVVRLINATTGTQALDLHLNRLAPGAERGRMHRHTTSENVYIIRSGSVELRLKDAVHRLAADQLHFLGVFRPGGEPALPEVPSLKAQGYDVPDIDQVWYTYAAPKTPEDRLARLEAAFATALKDPQTLAAQKQAGFPVLTLLGRADLKAIRARSVTLANAYRAELEAG